MDAVQRNVGLAFINQRNYVGPVEEVMSYLFGTLVGVE